MGNKAGGLEAMGRTGGPSFRKQDLPPVKDSPPPPPKGARTPGLSKICTYSHVSKYWRGSTRHLWFWRWQAGEFKLRETGWCSERNKKSLRTQGHPGTGEGQRGQSPQRDRLSQSALPKIGGFLPGCRAEPTRLLLKGFFAQVDSSERKAKRRGGWTYKFDIVLKILKEIKEGPQRRKWEKKDEGVVETWRIAGGRESL